MSTTDNLAITEVAANVDQKEVVINAGFAQIDNATQKTLAVTFTSNARTLTAGEFTNNFNFRVGTTLSATGTLTLPASMRKFAVDNRANPTHGVVIKTPGSTAATVTVPAAVLTEIVNDGTNIIAPSSVGAVAAGVASVNSRTGAVSLGVSDILAVNAGRIIGNGGTAAAVAAEITIGSGLTLSTGNTLSASVSGGFPITAAGATQSVGQMTVTGTNAGMAVVPNGTGAIMAAIPDATSTGGNARGSYAIDWQVLRSAADQVASGLRSIIVGARNKIAGNTDSLAVGVDNNVSQAQSVALGRANTVSSGTSTAIGDSNTVSGSTSAAIGVSHTVSSSESASIGNGNSVTGGQKSYALGYHLSITSQYSSSVGFVNTVSADSSYAFGANITVSASGSTGIGSVTAMTVDGTGSMVLAAGTNTRAWARGNTGGLFWNNGAVTEANSANRGRGQIEEYVFYGTTSSTTAVQLTTDAGAAGTANVAGLTGDQNGRSIAVADVDLVAINNTTSTASAMVGYVYRCAGLVASSGNTTKTVLAGTTTLTLVATIGSPSALASAPTIAAVSTGNGGFNITFTPPNPNTDAWQVGARLRMLRVQPQ